MEHLDRMDVLLDAYVRKYPERPRERAYPFIIGMLSTLLTDENLDSFVRTVEDFA